MPTHHSRVVGGSTAERVMACPGSVALCEKMPPKPSSKYADEGTMLHNAIEMVVNGKRIPEVIGLTYEGHTVTEELADEMLVPAIHMLNEIDPDCEMEFETEVEVSFGDLIPDAFGTTDVIGKIGNTAIILDWKFGRGVKVDAEENSQLMYYAAAAMRTEKAKWAFEGVDSVMLVIVQPAHGISKWTTTLDRIKEFENELVMKVKVAQKPDAPFKAGDHCMWCAGKPVCPVMTRAVDRAIATKIETLDASHISAYLKNADLLETWIADIRALAHTMLENGGSLADWKLVAKRATRKWADEAKAKDALLKSGLKESDVVETSLISPAQAEKLLKKQKIDLPGDQVVAISSGSTLARADDPRPAVLDIGRQLSAAFNQIQ